MPRHKESKPKRWYITSMFKIVQGCYLDNGYAVLCDPKTGVEMAFDSFRDAKHVLAALKNAVAWAKDSVEIMGTHY
jgi:hypothetical protein